MKNSELFHYLSEILSLESIYSRYIISCICRSLSLDIVSFAVALPFSAADSFVVDLETLLADSPISITCLDDISDDARVIFLPDNSDTSVYLHFIIHS